MLLDLTHDDLKDMDISSVGERMRILILIKRVREQLRPPGEKVLVNPYVYILKASFD